MKTPEILRIRGFSRLLGKCGNVAKVYPFQVLLLLSSSATGLAADSKAQAEQIRSIATERLVRRIGRISAEELAQLDDALRLHLEL